MIDTIIGAFFTIAFCIVMAGIFWSFLKPVVSSFFGAGNKIGYYLKLTANTVIRKLAALELNKPMLTTEQSENKLIIEVETKAGALFNSLSQDYEAFAWARSIAMPKFGTIKLRGYESYIDCTLLPTARLSQKYGKRVKLENIVGHYEQSDLSVDSLAKKLVMQAIEPSSVVSTPSVKKQTAEITSINNVPAASEPVLLEPAVDEVKVKTPIEAFVGVLKAFGKTERLSNDESPDAAKSFKQFRVLIRNNEGIEEPVWGQDLHRAIKEAGAEIGDKVKIFKVGRRKNEHGYQNLFNVEKVA